MAIIDDIAADCGAKKEEVQEVLNQFFELVADTLIDMDTVIVPGFGQFEAKKRKERVTVHPASGRRLLVPPKIVVGFKPSGVLKSKVK